MLNLVVLLTSAASPGERSTPVADTVLVVVNALVIRVANLAFEVIGLDLCVAAAVAVPALALLRKHPRQLVPRCCAVAYPVGLVATFAIKSIMGP